MSEYIILTAFLYSNVNRYIKRQTKQNVKHFLFLSHFLKLKHTMNDVFQTLIFYFITKVLLVHEAQLMGTFYTSKLVLQNHRRSLCFDVVLLKYSI